MEYRTSSHFPSRQEPIPPSKRQRKVLNSLPDPPHLFAKLHLQWRDFSLTDLQSIEACFDFSFLPHRFNHFSRDIDAFQKAEELFPKREFADPTFSDLLKLRQLFPPYRPNGLTRNIATYPQYIGELMPFLIGNESADLKSVFLSVFFSID
jgi:hypothetical protein